MSSLTLWLLGLPIYIMLIGIYNEIRKRNNNL